MQKDIFYIELRKLGLFNTLSQSQVEGIERLLDVWGKYFRDDPVNHLAYNLATSYLETGKKMQPVMEIGSVSYFNKYEPYTKIGKMLGNTKSGDGFRFRGAGDVQNTGRRNAKHSSDRINAVFGHNTNFVLYPEQRLDPFYSAICLFLGNKEGWWTGRDLFDYIDSVDETDAEDLREFTNARAVVNGSDKAVKIAELALLFEKALFISDFSWKITEKVPANASPPDIPLEYKHNGVFFRFIRWLINWR